jgi:uncharacterized membrane protein
MRYLNNYSFGITRGDNMKKNNYYIIASLIILIAAIIIYGAVSFWGPSAMFLVAALVIITAITVYLLRSRIDDALVTDELISRINEMAATRSLQITWLLLFASVVANLSLILIVDNDVLRTRMLYLAMPFVINLAVMLLIYAIFRIYYTKMYTGSDDDEESD